MNDMTLLTVDGHLSELTLDRMLFEPAFLDDPAHRATVDAHLDACAACRQMLDDIRAFDAGLELAPPKSAAKVITLAVPPSASAPPRRTGRAAWLGAIAGLAAAAMLAMVVQPSAPEPHRPGSDGIRLRGSGFEVEFHVHDGERSRQVDSGAVVHPGERLGFRVTAERGGHLLIVGIDSTLEPYVCYPQQGGGSSALIDPSRAPVTLGEAVEFDTLLGHERLVALLCTDPISLGDFQSRLADAMTATDTSSPLPPVAALSGCAQRDIVLQKRQR